MQHARMPARRWLIAGLAASLLAACGGGVDEDPHDDHDPVTIDTAGRLAIYDAVSPTLRSYDLDTAAIEASHTLAHVPSAVYASPGSRYAVVMQRTQDQVQFVDGGVWQEDHGDHLHDYKQGSRVTGWTLTGVRPTHYDVQAGRQAAIFMDGNAAAAPAQNAAVRLLTDASIGAGAIAAGLDLDAPIHGLGEPVDDKLLTVSRAADAVDALPTHLNLYRRSGATWSAAGQVPTRCDGMHGSWSSGSGTVVGCSAGMLLVRHLSPTAVDDGRLLATPLRVGTIAGHARLPDQFIGIATEGVAPATVTTRFYALDGNAGTVTDFVPQGWAAGRVRRAHAFDRSGQRFHVLDDQGTLIVSERGAGGWTARARVPGAVPAMPAAAPWPVLVANGARDEIYITDPVAQQLVVVDATSGAVTARRALGFAPAGAAWLGIVR